MSNRLKPHDALFPPDLPTSTWSEFRAVGLSTPVVGMIHRRSAPAVCGLPLGGISTGCIDIETNGKIGYNTIFNAHKPRKRLDAPFLGISVDGQSRILTTEPIDGIQGAEEIAYWGHYPVVDLEYELDLPIRVGLRAWAPFIPGDVATSNTPAATFDVHLRNAGNKTFGGCIAFSFPGITPIEEDIGEITRVELHGELEGVHVTE